MVHFVTSGLSVSHSVRFNMAVITGDEVRVGCWGRHLQDALYIGLLEAVTHLDRAFDMRRIRSKSERKIIPRSAVALK